MSCLTIKWIARSFDCHVLLAVIFLFFEVVVWLVVHCRFGGGFREFRRGTLRANFELSKETRLGHLKA